MGDCAGLIVSPIHVSPKPVKVTPSENKFPEDVIRLRWGHPGVGWALTQCDRCPYKEAM